MGTGTKVVGYVRVSTADQGTNGCGLDAQKRVIRAEAKRRGWKLLRIEQDIASGKSRKGRAGLDAAIAACEGGEADALVVAKLDRLSRSMIDFAQLVERSRPTRDRARGWGIVALDVEVDMTTPTGEMIAHVLAILAQWERRMIGQRTRDALAEKRAQGVVLGRPVTMPKPVRARIRRMHRDGSSLAAIARKLNEGGVATAQGGQRWYPSTVRAAIGKAQARR